MKRMLPPLAVNPFIVEDNSTQGNHLNVTNVEPLQFEGAFGVPEIVPYVLKPMTLLMLAL